MNQKIKSSLILMLIAAVWGFAFVAQRLGSSIGTFYFTGIRFGLGALTLIPVILLLENKEIDSKKVKATVKPSILTGMILISASLLQQAGIALTDSTGKTGFITSFYIILVPIIGILLHKKVKWNVWLGAIFALTGIFLLSITDFSNIFAFQTGDLLIFASAFLFALHILVIDYYSDKIYPIRFSLGQYITGSLIALCLGSFLEDFDPQAFQTALIPLLYGGCVSIGLGYTMQTVGQAGLDSTSVAIILSFESVFCVIGSAFILNETMTLQSIFGCILTFIGLIISQLNFSKKAGE